ncbi:hypothetical protein [Methylotuvimicrobium alcaliphilum]|nr:hypothetical protein [Methylotuvimicrobium alcaliphilum]
MIELISAGDELYSLIHEQLSQVTLTLRVYQATSPELSSMKAAGIIAGDHKRTNYKPMNLLGYYSLPY